MPSKNSYRTYYSLEGIRNDLPANDIFQVHQSLIVSLKHRRSVKRKRIEVGEYYVPVSKFYKAQLLASLGEILDREYFFYKENI